MLDVTNADDVAAAAEVASDVTVVINNAGAMNHSAVLDDQAASRELFETNYWGALAVADALTPALKASKGALLNVLSVLRWLGIGDTYSATKAALWSATDTQRIKLAPDGIHVAALHLGYTDTPMSKGVEAPKNDPADVVRAAFDGIEAGDFEILASRFAPHIRCGRCPAPRCGRCCAGSTTVSAPTSRCAISGKRWGCG
ncbi:SDR family NAD(P)-dependent oxidoreductase [Spirillospora sp. CA-255316]